MTPLHHSLFALEPQHGPSFSLSLLMQVHEAAAVVESGGGAGDAVATRRRLRGGEGPAGVTGGAWAGGNAGPPCWAPRAGHLYPTGRRRDGLSHGLLAVEAHCRFLRQCAGAPHVRVFRRAGQGPQGRVRSTLVPLRGYLVTGGCKARPDLRLRTAAAPLRSSPWVYRGVLIYHHRTPCICAWVNIW